MQSLRDVPSDAVGRGTIGGFNLVPWAAETARGHTAKMKKNEKEWDNKHCEIDKHLRKSTCLKYFKLVFYWSPSCGPAFQHDTF